MPWTPEDERDTQARWKRAFPDHEYRIDMIFAKRDMVVTLLTYTGTHRDTILGIPPTGRTVAVPEVAVYRLEGDLLAEQWVVFDEHLLRQQLTR
jgi:predicted ester cyclase